ncbi:hypothetical protein J4470_03910 [Candidatus Woesearchaeota archaeon]|nr:hypothetical protein [Candidatus Woesearchaeota archaeon]
MAAFMLYFWILLFLFSLIYLLVSLFNFKGGLKFLNENGGLFFIFLGALVVISIVTNDPVTVAGITIPTELQWFGSLILTGFGSWKFYLNPLKNKVFAMDRELGEVKQGVQHLEINVNTLTTHILSKKSVKN